MLLEHGHLTTRLRLFSDPEEIGVMERLLNRVVLTLLSIGVGLVSVLLLGTTGGPTLTTIGMSLYEVLGWIGLSMGVILLLRVLLAVLRNERDTIG
jgi:ubiquinone biosynthesis protein